MASFDVVTEIKCQSCEIIITLETAIPCEFCNREEEEEEEEE